jgi:hypothetical protein
MAAQTVPNHFDRGKPFYPLVMHYLVLLIGLKELAIRGTVGAKDLDALIKQVPALGTVVSTSDPEVPDIREQLKKLSGPLFLRAESQTEPIEIDIDEVSRELVANFSYLLPLSMQSAGSLLILAHEISKDKHWHDTGPLWEFLRHCRHAAAHGGSFHFLNGEPRREAIWGAFTLTNQLQGTRLFKDANGVGLLSPGDPIRLLWDIEQAYPGRRYEIG